jgi:pyrroline-5-carboxylate reductase
MKLGVIGCGNMGRALVGGILEVGLCEAGETFVYDAHPEASAAMSRELGVQVVDSNAAVVESADVILLCVKPQVFDEMLSELGDSADRLLISIAAGVQIATIESGVENRHRVIRVMPNTPALVGRGASGYALGNSATEDDATLTESLLCAVGFACQVNEADLDAVTALSGSGPAYVFLLIESLVAGGIEQGLEPGVAQNLAAHTVAGAAELLLSGSDTPGELREKVTSPNGTTFAALESFRADGFAGIVNRAVKAAADRSRELGQA